MAPVSPMLRITIMSRQINVAMHVRSRSLQGRLDAILIHMTFKCFPAFQLSSTFTVRDRRKLNFTAKNWTIVKYQCIKLLACL